MPTINLNTTVDIFYSLSADTIFGERPDGSKLGTCKVQASLSCGNIVKFMSKLDPLKTTISELPIANDLYKKVLAGEANECELLDLVSGGVISTPVYLAYAFDGGAGSLNTIESQTSGRFTYAEEPGDVGYDKIGIKDPIKKQFCDPCYQYYAKNPIKYKLLGNEWNEYNNLQPGQSIALPVNGENFPGAKIYTNLGFSERNPPRRYDDTIPVMPEMDPRTGEQIWRQRLNTFTAGVSRDGSKGIIAKYNGFNNWLYTRYFGGDRYDLIKPWGRKEEKPVVGSYRGHIANISVSIKEHAFKDRMDEEMAKGMRVVKITVTSGDGFKFKVSQPNTKFYRVIQGQEEVLKRLPAQLLREHNIASATVYNEELKKDEKFFLVSSKFIDDLIAANQFIKSGIKLQENADKSFMEYPADPVIKDEVTVLCCPHLMQNDITIDVIQKNDKGQIWNPGMTIQELQLAQAGLYSESLVDNIKKMDEAELCCEECNYCLISDFCPGLSDIIARMRQSEINLRNPLPTNRIVEGPQCVAYDLASKDPIPVAFLEE